MGASELLHYLPTYRVLICKECRYAIQPAAVSRHLKDLHHIYRSDRQELVEYAKGLQLVDPGNIILPSTDEAPVPHLPTENGLACAKDGCTYLCVTTKRMKNHWATSHKHVGGSGCSRWRSVVLQAFFRGNQLKYFIVSPLCIPQLTPAQNSEAQSEPDSRISEPAPPSGCSGSCPLTSELTFSPDWTADDIVLFNHFTQFTYHDMGQSPMSRRMWQSSIPEMAFRHDFLKHGILACSALHLAYLNPSERRQYHIISACHQEHETCNALLAFSHLLIVHCFAEDQDENPFLVKATEDPGLLDWLRIIRGSCTIFRQVWSNMTNRPVKPLIEENIRDQPLPIVPENPNHAARFEQLLTLPILGKTPPIAEMLHEQMTAYSSAIVILARAFKCAQAAKDQGAFTLWTVVQIWPARIPLEYLGLLRAREPAALVLLAHYCVLLGPLEEAWYMKGFRKRLLERIYLQLDEEWRKWLEWPFAEAGMTPPWRVEDL